MSTRPFSWSAFRHGTRQRSSTGSATAPLTGTGIGVALLAPAPERVWEEALADANDAALARRLGAADHAEGVCAVTVPNPMRSGPTTMSTVATRILDRPSR